MAAKRKTSKSTTKRATVTSLVSKRPDPKKARSEEWSKEWTALTARYGGPRHFAEETLGISYQSLWRYAVRGDDVPAVVANFIRLLAAMQSLKSPV
jgi:hypothetical protein